ncbi:MAG: PilZ domain-containing protein [Ignavibacteriales bacterium]
MGNRRASRRIPFRKNVKSQLSNSPNSTFMGYISDLSEDGISIKSHKVFPRSTKILIQLHLGDANLGESAMSDVIKLEGTVRWVSPLLPGIVPTMGVEFSSRNTHIKRIYDNRCISIGINN